MRDGVVQNPYPWTIVLANFGDALTLSASAYPGCEFASWTVIDGNGNDITSTAITLSGAAQATLTMPAANVTVMANYILNAYALTVVSANGAVTTTPSQATYHYGDTVGIVAAANPGYTFSAWTVTDSVNDDLTATAVDNPTSSCANLTMPACDVTISALYAEIDYSCTESVTSGTICLSDSGPYNYGDVITVTASAQSGYIFSGWSVLGASTLSDSTAVSTSLTVYDDFTLTASFTPGYILTVTTPSFGSVSVSPSQSLYAAGTAVEIVATPSTGYVFSGWTATGGTLDDALSATTTLTTDTGGSDCTLTGSFTPAILAVTAFTSTTWVYQNTPVTTADRHVAALTISVADTWGSNNYSVSVTQVGPGVVTPTQNWISGTTITPTGSDMVTWSGVATGSSTVLSGYLVGGRVSSTVNSATNLANTGCCTVTITVQGDVSGPDNQATSQVSIIVRPLGAISGDSPVSPTDKTWINGRVNGNYPYTTYDPNIFNVDGKSGPSAPVQKTIVNNILNGVLIQ